VYELVECGRLRLPVVVKVLALLVLSGEFEGCCYDRRSGVLDALIAISEGLARCL
jgi:hypothetical protein